MTQYALCKQEIEKLTITNKYELLEWLNKMLYDTEVETVAEVTLANVAKEALSYAIGERYTAGSRLAIFVTVRKVASITLKRMGLRTRSIANVIEMDHSSVSYYQMKALEAEEFPTQYPEYRRYKQRFIKYLEDNGYKIQETQRNGN